LIAYLQKKLGGNSPMTVPDDQFGGHFDLQIKKQKISLGYRFFWTQQP
jgi:hypothetical protein